MTQAAARLISGCCSRLTPLSAFPPKPPNLKHNPSPNSKHQNNDHGIKVFRRAGPKDWLKEQKKKSSKYLLAPIDASRQILNSAYLMLMGGASEYSQKDVEELQGMFKTAARDCVPRDRNSFVAFQANTGVEVCTFRLIVKNAASLLDDKDPTKLEAEAILNDLIRSFTSLNDLAADTDIQVSSTRQKLADRLMDTIASLNKFEQGIKDCLEV